MNVDNRQAVSAPIRYGRFSQERKTYTMVFSRLCYRQRALGTAQVVPCVSPVASAADLVTEADRLADAEGLKQWTWGAIGIMANPRTILPKGILAAWADYFAARGRKTEVFTAHAKTEASVLSASGILRLDWPTAISGKELKLDVLLATATAPRTAQPCEKKRIYARPREIGQAYARLSTPEYFVENVRCGIRTNQDASIWSAALRHRPEWAKEFADITSCIRTSS